jgi:hypothetical protein
MNKQTSPQPSPVPSTTAPSVPIQHNWGRIAAFTGLIAVVLSCMIFSGGLALFVGAPLQNVLFRISDIIVLCLQIGAVLLTLLGAAFCCTKIARWIMGFRAPIYASTGDVVSITFPQLGITLVFGNGSPLPTIVRPDGTVTFPELTDDVWLAAIEAKKVEKLAMVIAGVRKLEAQTALVQALIPVFSKLGREPYMVIEATRQAREITIPSEGGVQ